MSQIEKQLLEEVQRYKAINKYAEKLILEQTAPAEIPADPNAIPTDPTAAPAGDVAMSPDAAAAPPDAAMSGETETPPPPPEADDSTEDIDVTELVNMTKSIKQDLEGKSDSSTAMMQKMEDVFTKLDELGNKLGEMDQVIMKIDQLGAKVEEMKPPTPVEKLEMRSLDSYPFNQKPDEFFSQKQQQMRQSGKNEYVLTKGDVENYSRGQISKSFNPENQEYGDVRY